MLNILFEYHNLKKKYYISQFRSD